MIHLNVKLAANVFSAGGGSASAGGKPDDFPTDKISADNQKEVFFTRVTNHTFMNRHIGRAEKVYWVITTCVLAYVFLVMFGSSAEAGGWAVIFVVVFVMGPWSIVSVILSPFLIIRDVRILKSRDVSSPRGWIWIRVIFSSILLLIAVLVLLLALSEFFL